ncbi:DUF3943 domain-containing protein [Olivibacter sp. CPCC 100613]|uniref:DUF3943 domain-containing protein n=1 Tax=Olivibacter sp. CPCC 100613 TaxID=3079931 RepID=UPI002FFB7D1A
MKSWLILFFFLFFIAKVSAQTFKSFHLPDSTQRDSTLYDIKAFKPEKHFFRASGELLLVQLIPWTYDHFIRKEDWTKVSFKSIGHNLNFSNWEWDDNSFLANQFAHPYHGSLYFNAFRSNGYNFWQSSAAAFAGSFLWEVAGETNPSAPNDFINTSFGGLSLGEMTHRLANVIIKRKHRGSRRTRQELLAMAINPVNGFNRIISGKWGKYNPYEADDTTRITAFFDLGYRRTSTRIDDILDRGKNEIFGRLELAYGDPFEDNKRAFDNFFVMAEVGQSDSARLNTLRVQGHLAAKEIGQAGSRNRFLTLNVNYDYYNNSKFEYGGQSITGQLLNRVPLSTRSRLVTAVGGGVVILAAVPDHYMYYGEGRNYDYGPGIGYHASTWFNYGKYFFANLQYRGGVFWTINGHDSYYFLHAFTAQGRVNIYKNLGISSEFGLYHLEGHYKEFDDVNDYYPYFRLSASYQIGLQ